MIYCYKILTKEGPGYVYDAVDASSEYAFKTGVEPDNDADIVFRHIGLLIEYPDFIKHINID